MNSFIRFAYEYLPVWDMTSLLLWITFKLETQINIIRNGMTSLSARKKDVGVPLELARLES